MAKPKRPGGPKQKLSPAAAKRKAARDLRIAKTPRRTRMKAETQRKRRAAAKNGQSVKGKDWDHNRGRFVSEKTNRSATKTTNNTMAKKDAAKHVAKRDKARKESRAAGAAGNKKKQVRKLKKAVRQDAKRFERGSARRKEAKAVGKKVVARVKKNTKKK